MSDSYDPLDSLDEEVQRFKRTNTFTPMHVTHFYLQAGGVVRELRHARQRIEQLEAAHRGLQGDARLGRVLLRYIDRLNDEVPEDDWRKVVAEMLQAANAEVDVALAQPAQEPDRNSPPCLECGAETAQQAETMCICSGDKDHCHGCELWPEDGAHAQEAEKPESLPLMAIRDSLHEAHQISWCEDGNAYVLVRHADGESIGEYAAGPEWNDPRRANQCFRIASHDAHGLPVVVREPEMDPWAKYVHRSNGWIICYRDLPARSDKTGFQRIEDYNEREADHA